MNYSKEQGFNEVLRLIQGGIKGVSELVCNYYELTNIDKIKNQIIKSDNLSFSLKDVDKMGISNAIQTIAYNHFEYPSSNEIFNGFVDMFDSRDLMIKSFEYIDESELMDYEKEELKQIIEKPNFNFKLQSTIEEIFETFLSEHYFSMKEFFLNYTIEREFRLTKLRILTDRLVKAISENEEILNSNAKPHLKEVLKLCNDNYIKFYNKIHFDLQDYVSIVGSSFKTEESDHSYKKSRMYILNKLIDGTENLQLFSKYETSLIERGYLSKELNRWLLNPIDFIRFYVFCEYKKIFLYKYEANRKGINLLRELYEFDEGITMDYPNKRKKELDNSKKEYDFLFTVN